MLCQDISGLFGIGQVISDQVNLCQDKPGLVWLGPDTRG
jgi:hypothetical protein